MAQIRQQDFYFVSNVRSPEVSPPGLYLNLPGTQSYRRSLKKFRFCCVGSLAIKMLPGALTVLLTLLSLTESKQKDFYTFKVVNSRGKLVSLEKYRGSVSLVPSS